MIIPPRELANWASHSEMAPHEQSQPAGLFAFRQALNSRLSSPCQRYEFRAYLLWRDDCSELLMSENTFQLAAARAIAGYTNIDWQALRPHERVQAIYRELRAIDEAMARRNTARSSRGHLQRAPEFAQR